MPAPLGIDVVRRSIATRALEFELRSSRSHSLHGGRNGYEQEDDRQESCVQRFEDAHVERDGPEIEGRVGLGALPNWNAEASNQ